jgi:lysophospholipase L1-like esterase
VLNQGIGGNHMLTDGLGPNALARMDRDVLAQAGVKVVILFEGVNDLGALSRESNVAPTAHANLVQRLLASYEQVIARAHAQGIKAIGATITPFVGSDYYHPATENEEDREKLNSWIRADGHFDAVIDFDRVIRDPQHPKQMLPAYDSGDHLHPSPAGYRAMAGAIPLDLLTPLR